MKTKGNFNYFNDVRGKYLERVEKDGSVAYYRFFNRETKATTSCLPVWGRQEFETIWSHMERTN